jgi:hypothetical protein
VISVLGVINSGDLHIPKEAYMAMVYKEFIVNASPDFVWEAIRDVGAVHIGLAQGFVTNSLLSGACSGVAA